METKSEGISGGRYMPLVGAYDMPTISSDSDFKVTKFPARLVGRIGLVSLEASTPLDPQEREIAVSEPALVIDRSGIQLTTDGREAMQRGMEMLSLSGSNPAFKFGDDVVIHASLDGNEDLIKNKMHNDTPLDEPRTRIYSGTSWSAEQGSNSTSQNVKVFIPPQDTEFLSKLQFRFEVTTGGELEK